MFFTQEGIWGFSAEHLSGIYILSLPVEEWLFFVIISYASVFTYEVVVTYFRWTGSNRTAGTINLILLGIALIMILISRTGAATTNKTKVTLRSEVFKIFRGNQCGCLRFRISTAYSVRQLSKNSFRTILGLLIILKNCCMYRMVSSRSRSARWGMESMIL